MALIGRVLAPRHALDMPASAGCGKHAITIGLRRGPGTSRVGASPTMRAAWWRAMGLMGALASPAALAQPAPSGLPPTQAAEKSPVARLFGDWGGMVTTLGDMGIDIRADAVTEFAGNVSGGTRQGATFANQLGLSADINWERLAGLTGFSTHVIMVNRSGSNDSTLFGDNLLPVQEVYGSGGDAAVHLVSAYAQETLFDKGLDIAAGRMNVENDFASSPLFCNFMNNGLCGDPKALPGGDIGHSAYPDAVWAGRVQVRPVPDIMIETGIYEVTQGLYTDPFYRSGFKFDTAKDSGVYLPAEADWEPTFGAAALPGHYKLGFGYDTSGGYADFGNILAQQAVPGYRTQDRTGNTQIWALADQMLMRNGTGDTAGLIGLAGFVHNDPNNSAYAEQYYAGLTDHGFWHMRPKDGMGLLVLYNTISGRLGNVQAVEQALALPLGNNATGIQTHEMIVEANYDIQLYRGIHFQPDVQYVVRPNAQRSIKDAAVFGFKLHVQL
jgi:porin